MKFNHAEILLPSETKINNEDVSDIINRARLTRKKMGRITRFDLSYGTKNLMLLIEQGEKMASTFLSESQKKKKGENLIKKLIYLELLKN